MQHAPIISTHVGGDHAFVSDAGHQNNQVDHGYAQEELCVEAFGEPAVQGRCNMISDQDHASPFLFEDLPYYSVARTKDIVYFSNKRGCTACRETGSAQVLHHRASDRGSFEVFPNVFDVFPNGPGYAPRTHTTHTWTGSNIQTSNLEYVAQVLVYHDRGENTNAVQCCLGDVVWNVRQVYASVYCRAGSVHRCDAHSKRNAAQQRDDVCPPDGTDTNDMELTPQRRPSWKGPQDLRNCLLAAAAAAAAAAVCEGCI